MMPATALAQSSATCQAYNPQTCNVSTTKPATGTASSSSLPLTGLDIILLAIGGGTLAGAGLIVRRLTRRLD